MSVKLYEAEDLECMATMGVRMGSVDPYVTATLGNASKTTKTIRSAADRSHQCAADMCSARLSRALMLPRCW